MTLTTRKSFHRGSGLGSTYLVIIIFLPLFELVVDLQVEVISDSIVKLCAPVRLNQD